MSAMNIFKRKHTVIQIKKGTKVRTLTGWSHTRIYLSKGKIMVDLFRANEPDVWITLTLDKGEQIVIEEDFE